MKIIAHRGASFYSPENTIAAFKLAENLGADGIEMDVHITKDGKLVIIHDESTGRTGNADHKIESCDFETLGKIDVGSWFGSEFRNERIPLLEDVLKNTSDQLELYIEIKTGTESIDTFVELVKRFEPRNDKIVVISFNYEVVAELKKVLPRIKSLWIVQFGFNVAIERKMYDNVFKKIKMANLDGISTNADLGHCKNMAKDIKKNGWIWNVWTVDNPYIATQMTKLGVTSITSNRPDWIIRNLSKV